MKLLCVTTFNEIVENTLFSDNVPIWKMIIIIYGIYVLIQLFIGMILVIKAKRLKGNQHIFEIKSRGFIIILLIIYIYFGLIILIPFKIHYYRLYNKIAEHNIKLNAKINNNVKNQKKEIDNLTVSKYYIIKSSDEYYRVQSDRQLIMERSSEQQNIFENFFVVKRDLTLKKKAQLFRNIGYAPLSLGLIIFLIVMFKASIANKVAILWIIVLFFGSATITLYIISAVFMYKFRKNFDRPPNNLITSEEYEMLVKQKIKDMNIEQKGLSKLGLDIDQVKEIRPIFLTDKVIDDYSLIVYDEKKSILYSSTQFATLLYFTNDQVFIYRLQFDMCCNNEKEFASELFYVDICDIRSHDLKTIIELKKDKNIEIKRVQFLLISSNSKFGFNIDENNENILSLQAMRQKIRERRKKYGN